MAFVVRIVQLVWRGELVAVVKRLRPRGFTPAEYRQWCDRQPPIGPPSCLVPFVIALDVADASRDDLVKNFGKPPPGCARVLVRAAQSGCWTPLDGGDRKSLADWCGAFDAAWIWWIAAPVRLDADAPAAMAHGCEVPGARIVYADHDVAGSGDEAMPVFKPAWDSIQLLERPYSSPVLAVHASFVRDVDGMPETGVAAQWRFLVAAIDAMPASAVVHVPSIVAHLDRDAQSRIDGIREAPHVSAAPPSPTLSIIVPTRNRPALLERCLQSIIEDGLGEGSELVVVDNGSSDPRVAQVLQRVGSSVKLNVVSMPVPFNFAELCNAGAAASNGRVVVLLNNDTEVGGGWLSELAGVACRSNVGAVGPLLVYPDGRLQSAGVLLGVNRTATSALAGFRADDSAARAWCSTRRRVSAVLGACMAIERDKYFRIGGMDERFGVSHNELDFCLRLEAAGLANVFTPFARVVHEEGATRGFELTGAERRRLRAEEALFRSRWATVLAATDPAHHPALSRSGNPFLLAHDILPASPRAGWRAGMQKDA